MNYYGIIIFTIYLPSLLCFGKFTENDLLPFLLNALNNATRLFEKYVLRVDEVYWKLADKADPEYDFIVVGAGSAGSVVASRLSEIPEWRILLLEAGEPEDSLVDIPALAFTVQNTKYDWAFKTVRLTNMSYGLENQTMHIPRGKALGGSSVLNYMMFCRGSKYDYDDWAAQGNPGWSYKDVLPYFLKSEDAHLKNVDHRYHNTTGYLSVEHSYQSILVPAFLKAGAEVGLPHIDYNAPTVPFGVAPIQTTLRKGRRESVAKAFLTPARSRKNLDTLTKAFVTKILINERKEAYGVVYEKDGKNYTATAKKEVILSAGTIQTPQILMLSGIGPKKHLRKLKIKCIKDLAVGRNLQDHLTFYGVVFKILFDPDQLPLRTFTSFPSYLFKGEGPLAAIGGIMGVGYIKTNVSKVKVDQPDIELMCVEGSMASGYGNYISADFGVKKEYYESSFLPLEGGHQWTIAPVHLHPKSRGYVKLNSTNPHDQPLIDPRYFTDPGNEDIKAMIAGIRLIQRLGRTLTFKFHGATMNDAPLYGCKKMEFDSDEYWECALRSIANTLYHQIGTAKMGPKDDQEAVVDHLLQVYGIKNLRVADCSIMPTHTSGHTNAAAVMVGEKASDMIKERWGKLERGHGK